MLAAVAQAERLLAGRWGLGLLYYAGHGMQLDSHIGNGVRARRTHWGQPGWAQYIKVEREIYRPGRPPTLETVERVSRTAGRP